MKDMALLGVHYLESHDYMVLLSLQKENMDTQ